MSRTASGLTALAMTGLAVMVLAAPADAAKPPCQINNGGHYPPGRCKGASVTSSSQTPTAGQALTLKYAGLKPASALKVEIHSAVVGLGTYTAAPAGSVTASVRIPSSFSGVHEIVATGTAVDGSPITFMTSITVASAQNAGSVAGGGLPFTGDNAVAEGAAGLGLVAVGAASVIVARRRRHADA